MSVQYLGKPDLAKLYQAAYAANTPKSRLHHLAMVTQFWTGTRVSQLLDIRGEDVLQKDGVWVVFLRAKKRGRTATRDLHIDANPAFDMTPLIELARVKTGATKIFGGLSAQYLDLVIKRYAQAAEIHSRFAHSHIFRHSAAMAIFDATQRIGAVSEFLAHKSPTSAMIYLQENDNLLAQAAMNNLQLGAA